METIGMRIKLARIKNRLSQSEAVDMLSKNRITITQSYLSKMENDINEPDIGQLKAFSKIYNIDILDLIFSTDELLEMRD